MYVAADKYSEMKEEYEEMGFPLNAMPVDLNSAYVSLDVTQTSKESPAELEKAAHCNKVRFGLE